MSQMRFNHMELTLPEGALNEQMRADIKSFYGDVLGWQTMGVPLLGQMTYYLFLLLKYKLYNFSFK